MQKQRRTQKRRRRDERQSRTRRAELREVQSRDQRPDQRREQRAKRRQRRDAEFRQRRDAERWQRRKQSAGRRESSRKRDVKRERKHEQWQPKCSSSCGQWFFYRGSRGEIPPWLEFPPPPGKISFKCYTSLAFFKTKKIPTLGLHFPPASKVQKNLCVRRALLYIERAQRLPWCAKWRVISTSTPTSAVIGVHLAPLAPLTLAAHAHYCTRRAVSHARVWHSAYMSIQLLYTFCTDFNYSQFRMH